MFVEGTIREVKCAQKVPYVTIFPDVRRKHYRIRELVQYATKKEKSIANMKRSKKLTSAVWD